MPDPPRATSRPCVVITTYARPESLGRLLGDVEREAPAGGLDLLVYDDGTPHVDAALLARVRAQGGRYCRAPVNHGKRGWWRWWNTILADLRDRPAGTFFVLQDDMRLCRGFFERCLGLWTGIDEPRKGSLYLNLTAGRAELGTACWTPVRARRAGAVVECGWVDCGAFVCGRQLFDALGWQLEPIPHGRWDGREHLSSGVGRQLSVRAHQAGLRLYRTDRSLTVHDMTPSLMNGRARRRWSMETIGFVDGEAAARRHATTRPRVFASVASIPSREEGLCRVVEALLPQVEALRVYLNGYDAVPRGLDRDGVVVARSQDHGERGDAGKFFWSGSTTGHHLVCDDDIAYPDDYVERLVEGIERHGRRAIVGFHGSILHDSVADYHRSRRLLHLSREIAADTAVHVLGTGVAGWHTSAIGVRPEDFPAPNMADVWLALLGQRRRVPFVCLRRPGGWLAEQPGYAEDSLYATARRRARGPGGRAPSAETLTVRSHPRWELHGAELVRERERDAARVRPPPVRRPRPHRERAPARPLLRVRVAGPAGGATLVLPAGDHITRAVQLSGTYYERDLLDAIRDRDPRGTFVDVGAHYGNHTAFFGLECGAERIVAIEPSAAAHAGLLETVAENGLGGRVTAHRLAAHPAWRSVATAALPWRRRAAATNSGRVTVVPSDQAADAPAAPLDQILDGVAHVGLVKVDAGGLSADVLASGRRVLHRDRPLVAVEAATPGERAALRAVLVPLGYREAGRYCWTPTWLWVADERAASG